MTDNIVWDKGPEADSNIVWDKAENPDVVWDSPKDIKPPKRKVSAGEMAKREGANLPYRAGQAGAMLAYGAASVLDKAGQALGLTKDYPLSDATARTLVDPARRVIEENALNPETEEYAGLGSEITGKGLSVVGDMSGQLALGGAASAPYKAAAMVTEKGLRAALYNSAIQNTKAVTTAIPLASDASAKTYHGLRQQGIDSNTAATAATVKGLTAIVQGAMPLATAGTLWSRVLQGAAYNPAQTYSDAEIQNMIVGQIVENPNKADYIVSSLVGALFAGGLGERPSTKMSKADIDQINSITAQLKKLQDELKGTDVDTSRIKTPYVNNADVQLINRQNDQAAAKGEYQEAGTRQLDHAISNEQAYNEPRWQDPELADAIASANRSAQATSNLPQAVDVEQGIMTTPPEVDATNIRTPYMSPEEVAKTQEQVYKGDEPAHSYMEIPPDARYEPYWPDAELESAKTSANSLAAKGFDGGPVDISREGSGMVDEIINLRNEIRNNAEKLVNDIVEKSDAFDKTMAAVDALSTSGNKKEGGWVDLSEYTGPGFTDLVPTVKAAARNIWGRMSDAFKAKFDGGFLVDKNGVPVPLFHGTRRTVNDILSPIEKPFGKYNSKLSDGGMTHVGTIDSATIIQDSPYKGGLVRRDLEKNVAHFPSFQDVLKTAKIDINDHSPENLIRIKKLRNTWHKDLGTFIEKGIQRDFKLATKQRDLFVKKYPTKELQVKALLDYLITTKPDDIKFFESMMDLFNDSFTDFKNKDAQSLNKIIIKYTEDKYIKDAATWRWGSSDRKHIRPLFSSIKNPLFLRDIVSWDSWDMLIDELLNTNYKPTELNGHKQFVPTPVGKILSPQDFKAFANELLSAKDWALRNKDILTDTRDINRQIYAILEKYGFDSIIYENKAEVLGLESKHPTFSVATWKDNLLHDWVDIPVGKSNFVPRKERGSLNIGALFTRNKKGWVIDTPWKTAAEAIAANPKVQDVLHMKFYVPMTVNQKVEWLKVPLVKWAYTHMRTIYNEMEYRANANKIYLNDVSQLIEKRRGDALTMFKVLTDIQDPALKQKRADAEINNTREQFLMEHGMPENLVPYAIKVLDILRVVGRIDQDRAYDAFGHNWTQEPMYFPREHTGPYVVTVIKNDANVPDGKIVHMQPFESSGEAAKWRDQAVNALKGQDVQVVLERTKRAELGTNGEPMHPVLQKVLDNLIKEAEVAKRKYEMHRATHNITGYVGDLVYGPSSNKYKERRSDNRLLTALERRLDQSYELEVRARIIKEIKEPLIDNPDILGHAPNIHSYLNDVLLREIGIDIGWLKAGENYVEANVLEPIGKFIDEIAGKVQGYKGGDVSFFKSGELERWARAYTFFLSAIKLGLAPPVLVANGSTLLLVPVDGYRTASREGISTMIPTAALMKSIVSGADPEAMKWMYEAKMDGMVEPRISDPLQLNVTAVKTMADRKINYVRDQIEKATNYSALLYYYNFYKLAYPEMDVHSREFKNKVYEASRSWTGDYTNAAQLVGISKLNSPGILQSNFAKWKYNQIGRFMNDLQMAKDGNVVPMLITMTLMTAMAGAVGAPVAAEYEALRRLFGLNIPPLSGVLYENVDKISEMFGRTPGKIAEVLMKGPMTMGLEQLDMEATPDLSANLRHASVFEINTLAFKYMGDMYKTGNVTIKQFLKMLGLGPGPTFQERKEATKALPTVIANPVEEWIKNDMIPPRVDPVTGKKTYIDQYPSQDVGQLTLNEREKSMAYLGFNSLERNRQADRDYYMKWKERKNTDTISKNTTLIVDNLHNPEIVADLAGEVFKINGMKGVNQLYSNVQARLKGRATTSYERKVLEALNEQDPVALGRKLKELQYLNSARPQ